MHWLLYDIPTDATNSAEALWGAQFASRRPKPGVTSWGAPFGSFCGPCAYPLGYPPMGKRSVYELRLYVYRTNYMRKFREPVTTTTATTEAAIAGRAWAHQHPPLPTTTQVTLANFEAALGPASRDLAGTCSFRPVSSLNPRAEVRI